MTNKILNIKLFLLLLMIMSFIGIKAQTAGSTCTNAVNLPLNSYTNLIANTNTEGWFKYTVAANHYGFTLTNANNMHLIKLTGLTFIRALVQV